MSVGLKVFFLISAGFFSSQSGVGVHISTGIVASSPSGCDLYVLKSPEGSISGVGEEVSLMGSLYRILFCIATLLRKKNLQKREYSI